MSLARAAYSEADVIIMDDPLSSVDTRSAKHIYTQLIGPEGLLKDKVNIEWQTLTLITLTLTPGNPDLTFTPKV